MSSHHVVRDQQEPAVIVASPPGSFFPKLAEMFEWSPVVVVLAEALHDFLQWDTKLDVVVGGVAFIKSHEEMLNFQMPYQHIEASEQQLEKAISFLLSKKHKAVHIFSLKPDTSLAKKLASSEIELVFFTPEMKIVHSKASFFSKWVSQGTQFRIIEGELNSTENLQKKGAIYEARENGFANFYGKGDFWIGEVLK